MTAAIALLALASLQLRAEDPILLKERNLTSADWARVANHYIALGEERAVADLIDRSSPKPVRFAISNKHALHIARLFYNPKPEGKLRPPTLGRLSALGEDVAYEAWPCFPFAYQNGVIFLFGDRYQFEGVPETAKEYLAYLKANGTFRRLAYPVPTRKQAEAALEKLLALPQVRNHRFDRNFLTRQTDYR